MSCQHLCMRCLGSFVLTVYSFCRLICKRLRIDCGRDKTLLNTILISIYFISIVGCSGAPRGCTSRSGTTPSCAYTSQLPQTFMSTAEPPRAL